MSLKVEKCARQLLALDKTVAFVESATAGRLCAEFALVEGAGSFLSGGIVCYQARMKEQLLGVPHALLVQHTAESAEVTEHLAHSGFDMLAADIVVAVTGLLSPGGSESAEKPVGTMFLHLFGGDRSVAHREVFAGSPHEIMMQTVDKASELLIQFLKPFPEIL